jgi:nucleoid-associated protein YgaU
MSAALRRKIPVISSGAMRTCRILPTLGLPAILALSGCGYVHVGRVPAHPEAPAPISVVTDEKLTQENTDLRLEKKMLQQELALARAQQDALRMTIENRAADGDTSSRLVEKLNQTSRELASLRAGYAQLQSERNQAVASATEANALRARLGQTEEKLAESLRTYTALQGEVTRLRSDVDRTNQENLALTEQVKVVTAKNEQAQAALAQLNTDLLAQKHARQRAEQDAATLRTELSNVAPNASALAQTRTGSAQAASSLVAEHAAETAALKQELGELRSKVDVLATERSSLEQKLSALPDAAAKLASALRSAAMLRDENDQLKARLASGGAGAPPGVVESTTTNGTTTVSTRPVLRLTDSGSSVNASLVAGGQRATAMVRNEASGSTRYHVVTGGDTLAKISNLYYGSPARWGDILAANRDVLGETNNLVVGRTLRIP